MFNKLTLLKNIKAYTLGASVIVLAAFAAYNYTVYLNNKIDALVTDRETLTQIINRYETTTKQLEKTLSDNNTLMLNEIADLNRSFNQYEGMLGENRKSIENLSKFMSETSNEEIKNCLDVELDVELINRLFINTKHTTQ